jgi:hypothetical protein
LALYDESVIYRVYRITTSAHYLAHYLVHHLIHHLAHHLAVASFLLITQPTAVTPAAVAPAAMASTTVMALIRAQ